MQKRLQKRLIYFGTFGQILLLISMSFALAFIMSDNFVNGITIYSSRAATNALPTNYPVTSPPVAVIPTASNPTIFNPPATINLDVGTVNLPPASTASIPTGVPPPVVPPTPAVPKKYDLYGIHTFEGGTAHLVQGLSWSLLAVGAIQLIGSVAGLGKELTNTLSIAVFGGIMAGKGLAAAATTGKGGFGLISPNSIFAKPGVQFGVGLLVAVALFVLLYSSEKKKAVNFQCMPFEPKLGGSQCETCNKDSFRPCSEYRCKSLGQACELLNKGTANEQCAWVSRNDVKSPKITPWNEALSPNGLKYVLDTAVRPPAIGTKILTTDNGCLPAFTPLQFGMSTDEPAQCKVDYNHTGNFSDMQFYVGDTNYYLYNHTQKMRLPGPNNGNGSIAPVLTNNGNFGLYVRCRDANGNENVDEYVFSFCVDKGPDTTPPVIEEFSIPSGSFIGFNIDNIPIEVYVNEPSECKWSTESKSYIDMENSMRCSTQSFQVNSNLQYTCFGNLTGVKSREDNKFFFRCKDQPDKPDNERNVNVQSKELLLKGSQPLNIISISPNQTVIGSTDVVSVDLQLETSNGAENGKAACYFSPSGINDSFLSMFETNSFKHLQKLNLINGNYNFFVRCIDSGGNLAVKNTSFSVSVDKTTPRITRVYKQDALKIVTNEDAECSYSLQSCNFNFADGLKMIYSTPDVKTNLFAEWKAGSNYYIKCTDKYGNEPNPNTCSIIVNAIEFTKSS